MKNIIFVLLVSLASFAQAGEVVNFTGKWYGEGTLVSSSNANGFYCEFELNINQTAEKFEFGKFRYMCDELAFVFTPPTLAIKNGKEVYWQSKDQYLGDLEETKTKLVFHTDNGGTPTYTVELLDKNTMKYEDHQLFTDGWQLLNATLTKVQ